MTGYAMNVKGEGMRLKANLLEIRDSKDNMRPPRIVRTPIKAILVDYQTFKLPDRGEMYFILDWYSLNKGNLVYYEPNAPRPMVFPTLFPYTVGKLLEVRKKHWWEL